MKIRRHTTEVRLGVLGLLKEQSPPAATTLERLFACTGHPQDTPALFRLCNGASQCASAAFATLEMPNQLATSMQSDLMQLAKALENIYEDQELVDLNSAAKRRLSEFPAWKALVTAGAQTVDEHCGGHVALGVSLALALTEKHLMVGSYSVHWKRTLSVSPVSIAELLTTDPNVLPAAQRAAWRTFTKYYFNFRTIFDSVPTGVSPTKNFEERVRDRVASLPAFASEATRAAVLDARTLSRQQLAEVFSIAQHCARENAIENVAVKWLVAFSGIPPAELNYIPLAKSAPDKWALTYDVELGVLKRDLSTVAKGLPAPLPNVGQASSFISILPAPQEVAAYFERLSTSHAGALTLGDLLPTLNSIDPYASICAPTSDITASYSKLSNSVGGFARQLGIDSLLVSLILGNFGHSCKSKPFYCRVSASEIWSAVRQIYAALGLGEPVTLAVGLVPFGTARAPSDAQLKAADNRLLDDLTALRHGNHSTSAGDRDFHNRYVLAFGFRCMLRLSLRAAARIPLSANIKVNLGFVDLVEKSSEGRLGGMPSPISSSFEAELRSYFLHCKSLLARERRRGLDDPFARWLQSVVLGEAVPLLCRSGVRGHALTISSSDVLHDSDSLTLDFGRKWTENTGRLLNWRTSDIDRALRHEVKGQNSLSSVSDSCVGVWTARLGTLLEEAHRPLNLPTLFGLVSP